MFQHIRFALLWLALSVLVACSGLPGQDTAMYGAAPGPHAVSTASNLVLHDAGQARDIPLRVIYPQAAGLFPVVVYSHGAFCYPQNYAVVTEHWAAHGYVVVLPDHPDSANNQPLLRPDQMDGLVQTRIADLNFIFANLDKIATAAGIAGHSFGSVIAMAKAGLWVRTPDGGRLQYLEPKIRGAVIMSGVGQMDEMMAPDAFSGLTLPLIATGGTLDLGNTGGPVIHPWEWRMAPYTLAPAGNKYSVVLEKGDHYLGGLICRPDRGGDDDPDGAALDAALTLAFLDAYVKNSPQAVRFLNSADIPALTANRVRFERK